MGKNSTCDAIVDAAISLMQEKGFHPVTIKEIAARVGVSEMTVFRYFPSKMHMLRKALERASHSDEINTAFDGLVMDLEEDLLSVVEVYFHVAEERLPLTRIYFSAMGQLNCEDAEATSDGILFRKRLQEYFEKMQELGFLRPLPAEYLASTFWGGIFGLVATDIIGLRAVSINRQEYARHIVDIFLHGIIREDRA